MASFQHPTLNATFQGLSVVSQDSGPQPTLAQFRGIKFAKVPARFTYAEPVDDWSGSILDCTKFGPLCPQPRFDLSQLVGLPLSDEPKEEHDEFQCLRLNVTLPKDVLEGKCGKVPVMVWIHGGGFMATFGSAHTRHGDATRFVSHSVALGKPIILVSINYRVNIFGFSHFRATSTRKAVVNLGMHDQKLALRWVKRNIAAFNGDVDNITVFGESAGAISIHTHLQWPYSPVQAHSSGEKVEPLFTRAILQSGSLYTLEPLPRAMGEMFTGMISEAAGVPYGSDDVVERLREVPAEKLVELIEELGITGFFPSDDSDDLEIATVYPKGKVNWENQDYGGWLKALMMGDCDNEGALLIKSANTYDYTSLAQLFLAAAPGLGSDEVPRRLMKIYNIASDTNLDCSISVDTLNAQSRLGAIAFLGDARLGACHHFLARSLRNAPSKMPVYEYVFDEPSPFRDGIPEFVRNTSFHTTDLLHLFQGFGKREQYPVGKILQEKWIKFAHGEAPWSEDRVFAFGPGLERTGELGSEEDGGKFLDQIAGRRRVKAFELMLELGREKLVAVMRNVIAVKTGMGITFDREFQLV
ncbi:Alpha/Beta hydrolase protein [Kalaharituber pfeilii]|nr:Alpha/Beta hydrolase protein [Kalaharituber pfeilii]